MRPQFVRVPRTRHFEKAMSLVEHRKLIVGCGYLGRRVAQAWLARGDEVVALTRSESHAADFLQCGIDPILGDICNDSLVLPESDTVLFAVGYDKSSGRSQRGVAVDGLKRVLRSLAGRVRRFIYISSTSVYGQADGEWIDESTECQPVQPGGQICLEAESIVQATYRASDKSQAHAVILRLSGIYGPGRLLSRIESLRAGETIAGRGDAWLNLIHVDDAVAAILASEQQSQPGQVFLVTDDQPIRREEYYGLLAQLAGASPPVFEANIPHRGSNGLNKRCSNRRMRTELGVVLRYPTINAGLIHALGDLAVPASDRKMSPNE